MPQDLLRVDGIVSGYGRVQVLWRANLAVEAGQAVVLLGPNGAGKTTLLKVVLGLMKSWEGAISFEGRDVTGLRTAHRVRLGISYMSEMAIFPTLSISENLRIGGHFAEPKLFRQRAAELYDEFPDLASRKRKLAGSLSGGQRKMLGIAKALAGTPKLLVMDEPSAGLSPLLVSEIIDILARSRRGGLSFLIAEQNIQFLELADHVFTIEGGRTAFSGSVAELDSNDALREAYFGLDGGLDATDAEGPLGGDED